MTSNRADNSSTAPPGSQDSAAPDQETARVGRGRHGARRSIAAGLAALVRNPKRYQILGEHGRGALGRVSRAHDRELGRDVALKELLSRGRHQEARFLREAQITARLEHPGVVPVYEAGRWPDGTPFYAMKSVSGRPLRDAIAERRPDERIGLLHHVIAVADAIAYAHGKNVIHRDLKPANIIVGEFGETIVIDWGLAKDLSSVGDDALPDGGGDPGVTGSTADDLTATGSVLGTPAYMAPEQRRGEPVDQRADVFAIGVMLWELCAGDRLPPRESHVRRRALRRTGIDPDLVTIVDKALATDPARRYRDAGELAADLKAFKSGARIAARQYTLLALLAHWTRRHRALAIASAALVVIAAIAGLVYVRNVTAARDSAGLAQRAARQAEKATAAALDELTLQHAQTLNATDPSAALDVLARYRGSDRDLAERIRAEAVGRGVARVRAAPHTSNLVWTAGTADGAIFSFSFDGTIARTAPDGRSSVVARGVAYNAARAYAPDKHLLAYACDPSDVCLFDAARARRVPVPALVNVKVTGIALSPGGKLLAVLSRDGVVTVANVADPDHPVVQSTRRVRAGAAVIFVGDRDLAIDPPGRVEVIPLDGDPEVFPVRDKSAWDARPDARRLALGTASGDAFVLDVHPVRVAGHAELCRGPITDLRFVPDSTGLAYACRSGEIGIWDPVRRSVTPQIQLEGRVDQIDVGAAGNYLVAAGRNGAVTVLDLATGVVASYRGHGVRLTSLTAPTAEHPFVISGDVRGVVRSWPPPTQLVRVAAKSTSRFMTMLFDASTGAAAATTWGEPELTIVEPSGQIRTLPSHAPMNVFLEPARNGRTFAAFGLSDQVEVWTWTPLAQTRLIETGHGSVAQLHFVGDSDEFVTSGHDGRLVRRTPSGQDREIVRVDQPVDEFALVAPDAIVFSTVDGALWRTEGHGQVIPMRSAGVPIRRIIAVSNPARAYVGYANGDVVEVDAASWRSEVVVRAGGPIYEIAATGDGGTVAIAAEGTVHVGRREPLPQGVARLTWTAWSARARRIAVSPDGLVVAGYTDGTAWIYAPADHRWLCMSGGTADLGHVAVAPSGQTAAIADIEGHLLWIDLATARHDLGARSAVAAPQPTR